MEFILSFVITKSFEPASEWKMIDKAIQGKEEFSCKVLLISLMSRKSECCVMKPLQWITFPRPTSTHSSGSSYELKSLPSMLQPSSTIPMYSETSAKRLESASDEISGNFNPYSELERHLFLHNLTTWPASEKNFAIEDTQISSDDEFHMK